MNKPKVLISNPTMPKIAGEILSKCCDLIEMQEGSKEEILTKVKGVDGILWASRLQLDKEVLDSAGSNLKVIGTMSAGTNHIDVAEIKKRGIKLGNTVIPNPVANMAVLLTLAASRRLREAQLKMEIGEWKPYWGWLSGQDIEGATVGIIGLGAIGQSVVKRLKGFEVERFIYTGPREKIEGKELNAEFVTLDTLAKESDFIIVTCPHLPETTNLINSDFFSKVKNTAVLINVGRGEVVERQALIKALKEGQIFAAGLDVMTPEPLPTDDELLKLPNVVIMPHLGSSTFKTRIDMCKMTAQNILNGLRGEKMISPVV